MSQDCCLKRYWLGNTAPHYQTMSNKKVACSQSSSPFYSTKQTDEVSFSPGCLLASRPQAADREPPRPGNLYLAGLGTESVSLNLTSELATFLGQSTPQEVLPKTPLDNDEIKDSAMDNDKLKDALDADVFKDALDADMFKDTMDDGALKAPTMDGDVIL